ncbi:hypothetical protein G7046_g4802 [Stylonectria norvegica]|nr:hypothetical protein G7046_g4802 [Stylonectria norvegica]
MAKIRVPSWLQSSSPSPSTSSEADRKKQNRRSFTGFAQFLSNNDQPAQQPPQTTSPQTSTPTQTITPTQTEPPTAPVATATATAAAPSSTSHMIQLARKITEETEKLDKYLKDNGLPDPGFGPDAPGDFPRLPPDVQQSRQEILFASKELETLVRGPRETVRWGVWGYLDTLSLQIINSYKIASLVPVDGTISLTELHTKTTLDPINLARVLHHAMTNKIFQEPTPGYIAHTASSRTLAEDASLQAWVGFNAEDNFPAAAHTLQALRTHPEATSLTRTGFNFAFDTVEKEPMFVTFGKDPSRAKRMGGAMASLTGGEGYEVQHFVDGYDLTDVDEKEGTLVDIGGSHGFVCVDLAKKWTKMKFVVQDLAKTVESAPKPISTDEAVAERITLQAHDFFTEQPVKDADGTFPPPLPLAKLRHCPDLVCYLVYYFRWILHNYSKPYALTILKGLIPALKPGARVVINDHCLRDFGVQTPWDERIMRSMDMVMLTLLNAQERTEHEFRELFRAADERFVFKGVTRTNGCRMSIVEAVWDPESVVKREVTEKAEEMKPVEEAKQVEEVV